MGNIKVWNECELTRFLVGIDSTNPGAYESQLGESIAALLGEWGFRVCVREVMPGRSNILGMLLPPGTDIRMTDDGGMSERDPALIYICHMDTVQKGEGWTRDVFGGTVENGKLYGRGACDMKGGMAAALLAARDIAELAETVPLLRPFFFIGTVDEEGDMRGVQTAVADGWIRGCDLVMDMEPTDETPQMEHRGRAWFKICVRGVTAHASMPEKGADAIAAAAYVISGMKGAVGRLNDTKPSGSQMTTITFGQIRGGYSPYVVPDQCELTVDVRLAFPDTIETVQSDLARICEQIEHDIPGISFSVKVTGNWPAVALNKESELLRAVCDSAFCVYGEEKSVRPFPGYTDTAVVAALTGCSDTLSFGPGSLEQAHKPDEYVELAQVERCRVVYRLTAERLLMRKTSLRPRKNEIHE